MFQDIYSSSNDEEVGQSNEEHHNHMMDDNNITLGNAEDSLQVGADATDQTLKVNDQKSMWQSLQLSRQDSQKQYQQFKQRPQNGGLQKKKKLLVEMQSIQQMQQMAPSQSSQELVKSQPRLKQEQQIEVSSVDSVDGHNMMNHTGATPDSTGLRPLASHYESARGQSERTSVQYRHFLNENQAKIADKQQKNEQSGEKNQIILQHHNKKRQQVMVSSQGKEVSGQIQSDTINNVEHRFDGQFSLPMFAAGAKNGIQSQSDCYTEQRIGVTSDKRRQASNNLGGSKNDQDENARYDENEKYYFQMMQHSQNRLKSLTQNSGSENIEEGNNDDQQNVEDSSMMRYYNLPPVITGESRDRMSLASHQYGGSYNEPDDRYVFRKVQSVLVPHTMDVVKKTNLLLKLNSSGDLSNEKDNNFVGENGDLNGVMLDQYKWSSSAYNNNHDPDGIDFHQYVSITDEVVSSRRYQHKNLNNNTNIQFDGLSLPSSPPRSPTFNNDHKQNNQNAVAVSSEDDQYQIGGGEPIQENSFVSPRFQSLQSAISPSIATSTSNKLIMKNMASVYRQNAAQRSQQLLQSQQQRGSGSNYMTSSCSSSKAGGLHGSNKKKLNKLMHHQNICIQTNKSNPLYSCIIGGGVVQSLAHGIIANQEYDNRRFMTNTILQQEFRLNKSHSLAELAKNFDQIKYPPTCQQKKNHGRSVGLSISSIDQEIQDKNGANINQDLKSLRELQELGAPHLLSVKVGDKVNDIAQNGNTFIVGVTDLEKKSTSSTVQNKVQSGGQDTPLKFSTLNSRRGSSTNDAQQNSNLQQPQWDTLFQNKSFRYLKQNRSLIQCPHKISEKYMTAALQQKMNPSDISLVNANKNPMQQTQRMIENSDPASQHITISNKKRSIDQTIEALQNKLNRSKAAKLKMQNAGGSSMIKMHQQLFQVNKSNSIVQKHHQPPQQACPAAERMDRVLDQGVRGFSPNGQKQQSSDSKYCSISKNYEESRTHLKSTQKARRYSSDCATEYESGIRRRGSMSMLMQAKSLDKQHMIQMYDDFQNQSTLLAPQVTSGDSLRSQKTPKEEQRMLLGFDQSYPQRFLNNNLDLIDQPIERTQAAYVPQQTTQPVLNQQTQQATIQSIHPISVKMVVPLQQSKQNNEDRQKVDDTARKADRQDKIQNMTTPEDKLRHDTSAEEKDVVAQLNQADNKPSAVNSRLLSTMDNTRSLPLSERLVIKQTIGGTTSGWKQGQRGAADSVDYDIKSFNAVAAASVPSEYRSAGSTESGKIKKHQRLTAIKRLSCGAVGPAASCSSSGGTLPSIKNLAIYASRVDLKEMRKPLYQQYSTKIKSTQNHHNQQRHQQHKKHYHSLSGTSLAQPPYFEHGHQNRLSVDIPVEASSAASISHHYQHYSTKSQLQEETSNAIAKETKIAAEPPSTSRLDNRPQKRDMAASITISTSGRQQEDKNQYFVKNITIQSRRSSASPEKYKQLSSDQKQQQSQSVSRSTSTQNYQNYNYIHHQKGQQKLKGFGANSTVKNKRNGSNLSCQNQFQRRTVLNKAAKNAAPIINSVKSNTNGVQEFNIKDHQGQSRQQSPNIGNSKSRSLDLRNREQLDQKSTLKQAHNNQNFPIQQTKIQHSMSQIMPSESEEVVGLTEERSPSIQKVPNPQQQPSQVKNQQNTESSNEKHQKQIPIVSYVSIEMRPFTKLIDNNQYDQKQRKSTGHIETIKAPSIISSSAQEQDPPVQQAHENNQSPATKSLSIMQIQPSKNLNYHNISNSETVQDAINCQQFMMNYGNVSSLGDGAASFNAPVQKKYQSSQAISQRLFPQLRVANRNQHHQQQSHSRMLKGIGQLSSSGSIVQTQKVENNPQRSKDSRQAMNPKDFLQVVSQKIQHRNPNVCNSGVQSVSPRVKPTAALHQHTVSMMKRDILKPKLAPLQSLPQSSSLIDGVVGNQNNVCESGVQAFTITPKERKIGNNNEHSN